MPSIYTTKQGETITDVLINATGTINNWELVIDANDFDTWTPILIAGQSIIIPDSVEIQTNILNSLAGNLACNNLQITDFDDQLTVLLNLFAPAVFFIDETSGKYVISEDSIPLIKETIS